MFINIKQIVFTNSHTENNIELYYLTIKSIIISTIIILKQSHLHEDSYYFEIELLINYINNKTHLMKTYVSHSQP
jgi:hypothetical protein